MLKIGGHQVCFGFWALGFRFLGKGFVFIELLVVIFIIVLLASMLLASFRFFQNKMGLDETADQIVNVLRLAQNKTLASEGRTSYGVHFESNNFVLFPGASYQPSNSSNQQYNLSSNLEIFNISLAGGGQETGFNRLTGQTNQFGQIGLRIIADPAQAKIIYISSAGQIGLIAQSSPLDTRQKDSRHAHFNYNQNTQDAVTLHLVFPDYPGDNYDISFQDYLNTDKTEFSWEGIVSVGPDGTKTEQRLKIHTHSLTVMATQFCIHRPLSPDQSYNDKALNILLDTEELIKYASDAKGTTAKGSSIWVSDLQEQ